MCRWRSVNQCLRYWRVWIRPVIMGTYAIIFIIVLPLCIIKLSTSGAQAKDQAAFVGGLFVLMTLPIALWEITQHLVHYTKPYLQKHVIRILWMVPIYALNAWLALLFPEGAIYMDTVRECYEAYVIYNFMIYLLNFLNANLDLEEVLENKAQITHLVPLCCLPNWKNGRELIQRCKHGILQYTVVRPVTTVIALICELAGVYEENQFTGKNAYTYIICINNFSQFMSMYCLVLFYKATREELQPMRPIAKFLCIKAVIFFSFFQGFIIAILVATGAIKEAFTADDREAKIIANSLQDFLICIEMFLAAIAHLYAFSYRPFVDPEAEQVPCCDSFWSMWDVSDVHRDIRDHIRVVGSTVKRQVTRRRANNEPIQDERTRLIAAGLPNASQILEQPGSSFVPTAGQYQSVSESESHDDEVLMEARANTYKESSNNKSGNLISF